MDPYPITENPGLLVKFSAGINLLPWNWCPLNAEATRMGWPGISHVFAPAKPPKYLARTMTGLIKQHGLDR